MLIGIMWPGDLIGLLPMLDGGLMPESHEARADTLLVFMPRPAIQEAMKDIQCLMSLVRAACFRARLANESIYLRAQDPLRCQLAKFLVYLSRLTFTIPIGPLDGPAWVKPARMNITQGELASLLGVARQTINRVMKEFLHKKIIARKGEAIEVIDLQQLLTIIEEDEPAPPKWRAEILSWEKPKNAHPSGQVRADKSPDPSRASPKAR
jgi:CRP-like cAMP-binding protein